MPRKSDVLEAVKDEDAAHPIASAWRPTGSGDRDSAAWDFFETGTLDLRVQRVEVDIVEHSVASTTHGTVLSLLWVPETSAAPLGM